MKRSKAQGPGVMDLVAGPQGSGKSTFFPVAGRGYEAFNIDERRKSLNGGSSQNISSSVQKRATADYETFIEGHIRKKTSFSIEVTLARDVTFEQAKKARRAGFLIHLTYVAANLEDCIKRVANRVESGGHGAKVDVLQETHAASMRNVARAIREFDLVLVYDNARQARLEDAPEESKPRLVLEAQRGVLTYTAPNPPRWLLTALDETDYDLARSRRGQS